MYLVHTMYVLANIIIFWPDNLRSLWEAEEHIDQEEGLKDRRNEHLNP